MKVKSEREVAQSCPTLSDPMDSSLPGSSIHGIFQARVLEWGAIAFSVEDATLSQKTIRLVRFIYKTLVTLADWLFTIIKNKKGGIYKNYELSNCTSKVHNAGWSLPQPPAAAAVTSVASDSVRPHRRQPTRLPCPWGSPGKNTGVGCHFLLQCMKVQSESEVTQSCPTLCDPMDCSLPGSYIHGIFQARVLEWGVIAFSPAPPLNFQSVEKTSLKK